MNISKVELFDLLIIQNKENTKKEKKVRNNEG